jgi:hypothetical protein
MAACVPLDPRSCSCGLWGDSPYLDVLRADTYISHIELDGSTMKSRKILDDVVGGLRLTIEMYEGDPTLHDYGIPRQSWIRGVKLMKHFGTERALELIDQRAERAADRGDYDTARRWRTLITAIHAIQEDEGLFGEKSH